jgi:hypothetical protein
MHAVSFYFMVYNFVKIHKTIKTTPVMEAGVTDFLWKHGRHRDDVGNDGVAFAVSARRCSHYLRLLRLGHCLLIYC